MDCSSHIYRLIIDDHEKSSHLLDLISFFYGFTGVSLHLTREHKDEEVRTWDEHSITKLPASQLRQAYQTMTHDDHRVTEAHVSVINVPRFKAFVHTMPVLTKSMVIEMMDDGVALRVEQMYALRKELRARLRSVRCCKPYPVNQFIKTIRELMNTFAHLCVVEPSITRAYYVACASRVIFELEGRLFSLSLTALEDQTPLSFDINVGFRGKDHWISNKATTKQEQDLLEECSEQYQDWLNKDKPLEQPVLTWKKRFYFTEIGK